MSTETITVNVDPGQVAIQKGNNYSLYLAKMVNGMCTVIWQSKGPKPSENNPAVYEPKNTFNIAVQDYMVNYGTTTTTDGAVTFSASGINQQIALGQTVTLDSNGLFGANSNTGTAGEITINNQLQGNPVAVLLDDGGNPIFFNQGSGMDIGTATFTPIDTYQIWFGSIQDTGSIIAENRSNVGTVTFAGGTATQTISYTADGQWVEGSLPSQVDLRQVPGAAINPIVVQVVATLRYAIAAGSLTYLLNNIIGKFSPGLVPTVVTASALGASLTFEFAGQKNRDILATFGFDKFETAVNNALAAAKADSKFNLKTETWTLSEPTVSVHY